MLAAWKAASLGARVLLLERNSKLGIKLLISGGGKCNITHSGSMETLLAAFTAREARFLKPSFHAFSHRAIMDMLEAKGVKTFVRPDGRVFPISGKAHDVVDALSAYLDEVGVEVWLNTRVQTMCSMGGAVCGVACDDKEIVTSHVVLATGGASYAKTGTTGDGYRWAAALGHTIVPIMPALAPLRIAPPLPAHWRGVARRDGMLMVFARGRKLAEWRGDILFSHEGITGPAALEVSRVAARALGQGAVELRFDFFPTKDFKHVDDELQRVLFSQREKMIASILDVWLPNRIVPSLLQAAEVEPGKRCYVLTREERRRIVGLLKSWKMGDVVEVPLDRGEVTAGGVALSEVDPKTMRSRVVRSLYVYGEVLDVAGPVGG